LGGSKQMEPNSKAAEISVFESDIISDLGRGAGQQEVADSHGITHEDLEISLYSVLGKLQVGAAKFVLDDVTEPKELVPA
jgi:hypothetical protein